MSDKVAPSSWIQHPQNKKKALKNTLHRPQKLGSALKGRIVQPPKTGLKCTSAAALTLQQTVACTILPFKCVFLVQPMTLCLTKSILPDVVPKIHHLSTDSLSNVPSFRPISPQAKALYTL